MSKVPDFGYNVTKPEYFEDSSELNKWTNLCQILQPNNKYERLSNYIQAKLMYKKAEEMERTRKNKQSV